jgi:hypothetical protein
MNDNHVRRENRGERIARDELTEGQTVVMQWKPYQWAADAHDGAICGRQVVTVERPPSDDIAGDASLTTETGVSLRDYGQGRRYVSGPTAGADDVPDRTDIGTGARYFEVNDE